MWTRHPLRAQAHFAHQKPHRCHEVLVVQERLTHAHENQVDAVAADFDALASQHRNRLAGNLPGREVALQPQLGRQAELAVHGAPTWLETQMVARFQS